MTTRTLNLIDDHRRLHLQQSEVEPTLVCVLLFVADRPVAYAHADVQRCRFSMSSDGPLFWVGEGTSFSISEQERWQIEQFLGECRPLLNAETMFSGRMNQEDEFAAALEAARVDAERYRWLRDREIPEWLDLWHQNPDRIDAAIDAAMEGENERD